MTIQLLARPSTRRRKMATPRLRPALEGLESRTVLNAAMAAPHINVPIHVAAAAKPAVSVAVPLSITGINLTNITRSAQGVLTATGTLTGNLLGHAFSTPLTATVTPASGTQTCPVLHLALNPIHLNVLGLKVDTSAICLNVTATEGPGNLLGNLLCGGPTSGLTGLLNQATALTSAAGTGTANLSSVTTGLNGLLNNTALLGGLNNLLTQATSHAGTPTAATNILNLSLGPVDLNLLGLGVHLDNCANGPVTVSISAQPGAGNLLGNLLSSVAHLLDVPGNPTGALTAQINTILNIVRLI